MLFMSFVSNALSVYANWHLWVVKELPLIIRVLYVIVLFSRTRCGERVVSICAVPREEMGQFTRFLRMADFGLGSLR